MQEVFGNESSGGANEIFPKRVFDFPTIYCPPLLADWCTGRRLSPGRGLRNGESSLQRQGVYLLGGASVVVSAFDFTIYFCHCHQACCCGDSRPGSELSYDGRDNPLGEETSQNDQADIRPSITDQNISVLKADIELLNESVMKLKDQSMANSLGKSQRRYCNQCRTSPHSF